MNKNNYAIWLTRILILPLFIFELLNYLGILDYSLSFTWRGLIITSLVIWLALEALNSYLKKSRDQRLILVCGILTVIMLYLDAFGDIFKFYANFAHYDQILHFLAGSFVAVMAFIVLNQAKNSISPKLRGLAIISITALLAVIYEIEEYIEDLLFKSNRLGDGFDTANDLAMALVGAILVAIVIRIFYALRKNNTKPKA